jgi:hypothetical protein
VTNQADVFVAARGLVVKLTEQLDNLPDPGDEPRPNQRERIITLRELFTAQRNHLHGLLQRARALPRSDVLAEWRAVLQQAIADFERELAALEDSRGNLTDLDAMRAAERRETQVRHALRLLHTGSDFDGGELLPDALVAWFHTHGVEPIANGWFAGRGGLQQVTERIAWIDRDFQAGTHELAHYVDEFSAAMPSLAEKVAALSSGSPSATTKTSSQSVH